MVYLVYRRNEDIFEIHWLKGQGTTLNETIEKDPLKEDVLYSLLSWLDD